MSIQTEHYRASLIYNLIYAVTGLFSGLACLIAGSLLSVFGFVSNTTWTARVWGMESKLTDETPGVAIFAIGVFIVFVTRLHMRGELKAIRRPPAHHEVKDVFVLGEEPTQEWRNLARARINRDQNR